MNYQKGAIVIEGHVQGLSNLRSLGEIGVPVFVVDKEDCIARYSKFCKKFFRCPDYLSDDFANFLEDLAIKENINKWILLPSNDHAVLTISKHRDRLQKYYDIITPESSVIENIYDKSKLLSIAASNNVPIPVTQYFATVTDELIIGLRFPVLTKGKNGLSFYKTFKKKAFLAENEIELRRQLNEIAEKFDINNTFTQELIPLINKTISYTAFCIDGDVKTFWMGEKLREHPVQFGTATFAKSIIIPECHTLSLKLIKSLSYTGVCEIEFLYDHRTDEYKLIEINPRTWLWVGLAKYCGVDYAKIIFNYFNNTSINYPSSYKTDIYWINPFSDFIFSLIAILKRNLKLKIYISSFINTFRVSALSYKNDMTPFFVYFFSIFKFIIRR